MPDKALILIGSSAEALSLPVVQSVLSRWPANERPRLLTLTFDQVRGNDALLCPGAAAWVLLDEPEAPALVEVIALIQDRHLPTMISRPGETRSLGASFLNGVVAAPLEAPPPSLAAVLRALWTQSELVRSLQAELAVAQEHQGGLCDQIGKIDEELRLAAQLQREFLPAGLPEVHGVQFAALFRPAGYVSGDIYDVVRLDEDHVGFFIADAVGHGVPAALMTVYIKRSLRVKEIDRAHPGHYRIVPPDEALARLNHDMIEQQAVRIRTASACYGIINCLTLEVAYARAGHPFPMLLRADGRTETLRTEGGLLGVFADDTFALGRVRLDPGDRLVFYSDGFELAFRGAGPGAAPAAPMASNRYADEFRDLAEGPLDQALARLAGKLDEQAGSLNQLDDLTIVCVGVPTTWRPTASCTHEAALSGAVTF